jgi:hypothetical protein
LACESLDFDDKKRSSGSDNDTLSDVETKIENLEKAEQRTLEDLFNSLGIEAELRMYIHHTQCKTNTIPIVMHQIRILTNNVMLRSEKLEIRQNVKIVKEPKKPKQSAMKLSQIVRRIKFCMKERILPFEMNL